MTRDLAEVHEPITDLFPRQAKGPDGERFALTDDQLAQFERDGFVGHVPLLEVTQIQALRDELEEFFDSDHEGRELWYEYHSNESDSPDEVLFHALGAWRLRPAMHDILWHAGFVTAAEQLLGGPVRFWHDQLFCKPAGHGGVVAWHQDYSYWTRTKPMQHLTCWIGLDNSTIENGCVHFVPGSHRWPLLPMTNLANNMEAIREILSPEQLAQFQPVACEMPAGYASFHHPLMVHGSYENRSSQPRRAIVLNVFRDGTLSDKDEPMLDGTDPIPPGQPMGGKFYPLLSQTN